MSAAVQPFPIPPIVKSIIVACSQETAFRVFTREIGSWYPLELFSIHPAVDCRLEPFVGGRLFEIGRDGQEAVWARVIAWEPPRLLSLSWQARVSPEEAQRVDVTFHPVADGTQVRLVHAGWEKVRVEGAQWRDRYDGGWVEIFERRFKVHADKSDSNGAS